MIVEGGVMRLRADNVDNWLSSKPAVLVRSDKVRLVAKVAQDERATCVVATLEWAAVDDVGNESWRRQNDPEMIALGLLELTLKAWRDPMVAGEEKP